MHKGRCETSGNTIEVETKEKKAAAAAAAAVIRCSITCLNDSRVSVLLNRKGDSVILRVWSYGLALCASGLGHQAEEKLEE